MGTSGFPSSDSMVRDSVGGDPTSPRQQGYAVTKHAGFPWCCFYVLPYDAKLDKLAGMPKMPAPLVDGYTPKTTECGEKGINNDFKN